MFSIWLFQFYGISVQHISYTIIYCQVHHSSCWVQSAILICYYPFLLFKFSGGGGSKMWAMHHLSHYTFTFLGTCQTCAIPKWLQMVARQNKERFQHCQGVLYNISNWLLPNNWSVQVMFVFMAVTISSFPIQDHPPSAYGDFYLLTGSSVV